MTTNTIERKRKASSDAKASNNKQERAGKTKTAVPSALVSAGIVPNERAIMIEEAAYYRAERRGFDPADQLKDWLEAESEVDALLSKNKKVQN